MNVKHCNERKAHKVFIKEKDNEMYAAMKDADLESTKALGNHLVIEEVNILAERQGKETI